ncbi:DUF2141 domain-containing protein [Sphingorhabdus buctiana]|uniref:DUF2141 domain-containing protein n=1 Tax=Sphingorhabdus buctiana TaxID=1508805 RepID=A0ABW4M8Z5_9SPHN
MRNSAIAALVAIAALSATPLAAQNGACSASSGPAIHVVITGLKHRKGTVRLRLFSGDPKTYFDKRFALQRVEFATPDSGSVEYCIMVPRPGIYAVDVRHDTNGNGKSDTADGAGVSGNPKVSALDVVLKKKPRAEKVQIKVGDRAASATIAVQYFSGSK